MKKLYLSVILLGSVILSNAQSNINLAGQNLLRKYKLEQNHGIVPSSVSPIAIETTQLKKGDNIAVIVELGEDATIEDLELAGAKVLKQRENLAIVTLPIDQVEDFAKNKSVKRVQFGTKMYANLDKARAATSTSWAHLGMMVDHKYTGAGVVTGLMDQGIDPNHVAFMNSDQSASRVKRVWTFMGEDGSYDTYETPEAIASFTTDSKDDTHGTHVAGILAGGYESDRNLPYYGVAKGSDIAMSAGQLYDANIIYGIENIIEYALAEGKPAVVNLSLGNNVGPHDGTDLFSQYLDILGKYAVICVSAGNEGNDKIVLNKTFTESDKKLKSFVVETIYEGLHAGTVDIWSDSNKALSVTPMVYDAVADTVVYKMPTINKSMVTPDGKDLEWIYVSNGSNYTFGDLSDPNFDKAFKGTYGSYIGATALVDGYNNRYETVISYYLQNTETNKGNYVMAFEVEGEVGQKVYVYTDGSYSEFSTKNLKGWDEAITDGTISNMACGKNIIVVGSFNSRGYGAEAEKEVSSYSSYGTLVDGRELPHICAPGCMIYSAANGSYIQSLISSGKNQESDFAYKATVNGKSHYWLGMAGTSMASPFFAGAVALWLEANPYLERDDVLAIAQESASKDSYVTNSLNPVKWGAGKLNVIEGLKLAIASKAGISDILTEEKRIIVTSNGDNRYEVFVAGEDNLNATLYNMSGVPVLNTTSQDETIMVDASNLVKGVYVLSIQGETAKYTKRILVK